MAFCRLFRVFLRKNLLFLRFNWMVLTIIFAGCFLIVSLYLKSTYQLLTTPSVVYEPTNIDHLLTNFPANDEDIIYYTPSAPYLDALMENVRIDLQRSVETVQVSNNSQELRWNIENKCKGNCYGIHFEKYPAEVQGTADVDLSYALSSTTMRVSPKKHYVNDEELNGNKEYDDYLRSGFLTLQHILDKQHIKLQTGQKFEQYDMDIVAIPTIEQQAMQGDRLFHFGTIFSILFSVLLLSTFIVPLVEEKQDGLKEFLVIATPLNFLNGVTFFLVRFVLYFIFALLVLTVGWYYQALGIIGFFYVMLLFVLYMLSVMCYAYLISVCFHTAFYAKVGGLLLLVIPYIFYFVKGGGFGWITYYFSTRTFLDGIEILQIFTNKYRPLTYQDLFVNITENSSSMLFIYFALILECLLYSLLYLYFSNIFPGPGGLKKPYTFPCNPATYRKKQRNQYTTSERGPDAIKIMGLCKKFKNCTREITISDHLDMTIKDKQITVLLGHNGAGKTTTLNMIMGSVPKDAGNIMVCCERDVSSYRHLIGFCPQHSVFMQYMTCAQHLEFFAELRGMSRKSAVEVADRLLIQLKLMDKKHEYGKNLSGGMKRRLSLGIAISGDTKVVVLDEPSSGLDIESRRELWDILLELRKRKAVLVTTHHMEEAEVLGDTICILANGRLQRTGSPLELKRRDGCGYILKLCMKEQESDGNDFDEKATLRVIQRHIPTAKLLNIVPPTVLISMPYAYKACYSEVLKNLEEYKQELGITSISITDTSLEDVFLNCAIEQDEVDSTALRKYGTTGSSPRVPYKPLNVVTHMSCFQQFAAICYKKLLFLRSEWKYVLLMISLPFISMGLAVLLMHYMSLLKHEDVLPLTLRHIREGEIYVRYNDVTPSPQLAELLKEQITSYGIKIRQLNESNTAEELMEIQEENLAYFLQNAIGVIEVSSNDIAGLKFNMFYSGNVYHSSVILLNLIDNTLLKLWTQNTANISTTYEPIRRLITDVSPSRLEYYAVIVPIGMFFCMFLYVSLPFRENLSGFKQLQAMPRLTFWLSNYAFDALLHLVLCLALYLFQQQIMPPALYNASELQLITKTIFFYGLSYLPILYAFANGFKSISTISTYLLFMFVASAIAPLITSSSLAAMQQNELAILFLSLLPDFNLNHQLRIINENYFASRRFSKNMDVLLTTSTFFVYAVLIAIFSMIIHVYLLENKEKCQALKNLFSCYSCRQVTAKKLVSPEEEEGLVKREKTNVAEIIQAGKTADYPLLVKDLYKFYDRKAAVCGLNFAVQRKECFGLLGVNGAGKTSTFQMITANDTITGGTIKIDGIDILCNETQYRYRFGYCPQYDCLNNFMTAYQLLTYMAKLRGVACSEAHNEVMYWLETMDLEQYQHVQVRHYSGGTKRKLNAAVAMIASPPLVLLDEPTTGVDPVSRSFLWKCIQEFQSRQKTVVLTSHSMDECEHLCNRLAIMADGRFKCLGNVPDLKLRFGAGFTIKVKTNSSIVIDCVDAENMGEAEYAQVRRITHEMREQFPDSELRENHAGMLTYFIRNNNRVAWWEVFKRTEKFLTNCSSLVDDYSVNESTLEDIFLKFNVRHDRSSPTSSTQGEEV